MDKTNVVAMNKYNEIIAEIEKIKAKNTMQMQDVQTLALCYGALQALNMETTDQQYELTDIFPALSKYQTSHSEHDLKKLCLEIQEFCQSLYVTIANDEHRKIYFDMTKKLTTF